MALWPNGKTTPGDVWHEYGKRDPIWTPNGWTSSFHHGIDIGPWNGSNTVLRSPVAGVVEHAGYDDIFGNRVNIVGEGATFKLCHGVNGSIRVKVGDTVTQKQPIMLMGETGKASGRHLHYEVWVGKSAVDPRDYYRDNTGVTPAPIPEEEDEEMVMSYINIAGEAGKRRGGAYAILRDNKGQLFARFCSTKQVPGVPLVSDKRALEDWDKVLLKDSGIR